MAFNHEQINLGSFRKKNLDALYVLPLQGKIYDPIYARNNLNVGFIFCNVQKIHDQRHCLQTGKTEIYIFYRKNVP